MLLTAALSLSLFSHLPRLAHPSHGSEHRTEALAVKRHARIGPWHIDARRDRFAATAVCTISGHGVSLHKDTLIFRLAPDGDTTHTVFRVDGGPPRLVSEGFEADAAHGFFPQRGWVIDPNGGEAALPASTVAGAKFITLRMAPKHKPLRFKVDQLHDAIAAARAGGCTAVAP